MTGRGGVRLWKVLGVAGLAGVAATGAAVARSERRRRAYEPDDIRTRLHERHQEAVESAAAAGSGVADPAPEPPQGRRRTLSRLVPRRRRR